MSLVRYFILLLFIFSSCCVHDPHRHVKATLARTMPMTASECMLVILVDARQLDYSSNLAFFRSMVKHPSDGSKNSDVGHAWIYLTNSRLEIEGGQSGERGMRCPKYFEGVMDLVDAGDPNPIRYLWQPLNDGFFQEGAGGHVPTFAIKITITPEQFDDVLQFIESYDFATYALTDHQCCNFVQQVALQVGLDLEIHQTMSIQQTCFGDLVLWRDPCYGQITFPCPEVLECSMLRAVQEGKAEAALHWYKKSHKRPNTLTEDICHWPSRMRRVLQFY